MTDDEILKIRDSLSQGEQFDKLAFGRAVAEVEREACARVCEAEASGHRTAFGSHCAWAIRMRSNEQS